MKHFQEQGYYFRYAAVVTLITGMYLHITNLFIGQALLKQYILTPTFDMLLAIPMTYAAIVGWMFWKKVSLSLTFPADLFAYRSPAAAVQLVMYWIAGPESSDPLSRKWQLRTERLL